MFKISSESDCTNLVDLLSYSFNFLFEILKASKLSKMDACQAWWNPKFILIVFTKQNQLTFHMCRFPSSNINQNSTCKYNAKLISVLILTENLVHVARFKLAQQDMSTKKNEMDLSRRNLIITQNSYPTIFSLKKSFTKYI